MPVPPPLPTSAELDAMSFREQVATLTAVLRFVIEGYQRRLAIRQLDGRTLSATDTKNLRTLVLSMECLLLESKDHLEPGSMQKSIDAAFAALLDAQPKGHID